MIQQDEPSDPMRVWSVDDHPITGCALDVIFRQAGIRADMRGFASPSDVRDALPHDRADLVIVDLIYPDESGVDLLHLLAREYPRVVTLVYTAREDIAYIQPCLDAGARGYMRKGEPLPSLVRAVRSVMAGEVYLHASLREELEANPSVIDSGLQLRRAKLSRREYEVLMMIGEGQNTRQIAKTLCRSVKTIETYRARLKNKLGLENATQLAQAAWLVCHEFPDAYK